MRRWRAVWCAARGCLSRVLTRGRFDAAPDTHHAFFPRSAGSMRLCGSQKRTPPLCSPHGGVPPPPEGAAPVGFPLGLLLAGVRKETQVWSVVPLQLTRLRSAARFAGRLRSRLKCSPSGRSTPESFGRFCAAFALAAQSRSHAGCALGGDRLARSVCKQTTIIGRLCASVEKIPQA